MAYTTLSAIAAAIASDAGQAAYTKVGAIDAGRREGPPRVCWVPGSGDFEAPNQDESELSKIGYTHKLRCRVVFLGADYDAADLLMRAWAASVQKTQGYNCMVLVNSETPDESLTNGRCEITVNAIVDLPIAFETYTTAKVEIAGQTGAVTDPT